MNFTKVVCGSLLVLLGLNTQAFSEETIVSIDHGGQNIVATFMTPDAAGPVPVVLMLPGFGSVRDELPVTGTDKGVYAHLAQLLSDANIASLRIDYRGSGDSDGAWEDTSFSSQISDALVAMDWLEASQEVDGQKIAVVGWSQGGLVAAHVAAARPDVASVALWAPVVNPRVTFGNLLSVDMIDTAIAAPMDEVHVATLPWGAETKLKGGFYRELMTNSPVAAISKYEGPLLVIVGANDDVVSPQPQSGQIMMDYHDGEEKLSVFETGHVWGAFEGPDMLMKNVFPTTIEWIKAGF